MIECVNGCGIMNQTLYEGVEIDFCKKCAGVWLDFGELTTIIERKEKKWPQDVITKILSTTGKAGMPLSEKSRNLTCNKCKNPLAPVNYQNHSGIIVNTCLNGHGLWLDAGELDKIQIYMEKWAALAEQNAQKYQAILDDIEKEQLTRAETNLSSGPSNFEPINALLTKIIQLFD